MHTCRTLLQLLHLFPFLLRKQIIISRPTLVCNISFFHWQRFAAFKVLPVFGWAAVVGMFKDTSVVGVAHFISFKNVSILSASPQSYPSSRIRCRTFRVTSIRSCCLYVRIFVVIATGGSNLLGYFLESHMQVELGNLSTAFNLQ